MAIYTFSYAATVTWDGGAGTSNWMDATNWDTDMIPTMADDVDIDGASVVLSMSTQVQRVYLRGGGDLTINMGVILTIDGFAGDDGFETTSSVSTTNNGTIVVRNISGTSSDGIYSRGTFVNNGTITIDGIGQHGLYMVGGMFTNGSAGSISVTNCGLEKSDADQVYLDDSGGAGTFTNDGSLSVTMSGADDGIYLRDGVNLNNNGNIDVGGAAGDNGIRIDDGIFNNNVGGVFTINSTPDDQLFLDDAGAFNNAGTVNLNSASDVGLYVTDQGVFTNIAGGVVNITGASNFAIQVDANGSTATVSNSGNISVSGGSNDALRIQESGTFSNNNGATFAMTGGDDGISIESSGGTLNNGGTIDISAVSSEGLELIGGTFNNLAGGLFQAANCSDDGIEVNTAVVNNDGAIKIFGSGSEDIETFAGFTFNNSATATFAPGNSPGEFELKGNLDLGASTTTFEINGTSHTVDYDRIENFTGSTITISGATAFLDWGTFVPSVGDKFTIIDGSGLVGGTFATINSSNPAIAYIVNYADNTEVEIEIIAPLPVELISFTGTKINQGTALSWQTASEINNEGFAVERSQDGDHWTKIGFVRGNGNMTDVTDYDFFDTTPTIGTNYYRLKQIDFNGRVEYSNVVVITFDELKNQFTAYPNPVKEVLYLDINPDLDQVEIQLFNTNGQMLWSHSGAVQQIPFDTYTPGLYFLKMIGPNNQIVQKIIHE